MTSRSADGVLNRASLRFAPWPRMPSTSTGLEPRHARRPGWHHRPEVDLVASRVGPRDRAYAPVDGHGHALARSHVAGYPALDERRLAGRAGRAPEAPRRTRTPLRRAWPPNLASPSTLRPSRSRSRPTAKRFRPESWDPNRRTIRSTAASRPCIRNSVVVALTLDGPSRESTISGRSPSLTERPAMTGPRPPRASRRPAGRPRWGRCRSSGRAHRYICPARCPGALMKRGTPAILRKSGC